MKRVDFTIVRYPAYIVFSCPYCGDAEKLPWDEVPEPESWGDEWGCVRCPGCGLKVKLGEYDMD